MRCVIVWCDDYHNIIGIETGECNINLVFDDKKSAEKYLEKELNPDSRLQTQIVCFEDSDEKS